MIEVKIAGIQISLMSQHRVVLLKELDGDRYLPIWIGQYEADAINIELQHVEVARPLTHDLLKSAIEELGAIVQYIVVSELRDDTFHARIIVDNDGQEVDIDSRPSDAMALAVRARVPIYVTEEVMAEAGIVPEHDLSKAGAGEKEGSAFDDFLGSLNIDDLPIH